MSDDVSLREYLEARFTMIEERIDSSIRHAVSHAEFGDRQNAQAIEALGAAVTTNTGTIQRHGSRLDDLETHGLEDRVRQRTVLAVAGGSFTIGVAVVPIILQLTS